MDLAGHLVVGSQISFELTDDRITLLQALALLAQLIFNNAMRRSSSWVMALHQAQAMSTL